jgi:hypothetical protein
VINFEFLGSSPKKPTHQVPLNARDDKGNSQYGNGKYNLFPMIIHDFHVPDK